MSSAIEVKKKKKRYLFQNLFILLGVLVLVWSHLQVEFNTEERPQIAHSKLSNPCEALA